MKLEVGGICAEVVRRQRQKTVRVSVQSVSGDVRVSAPSWLSDDEIARFVESKLEWIKKHVARAEEQRLAAQEPEYVNGETHELWGSPYRLAVIESGMGSEGGGPTEPAMPVSADGPTEPAVPANAEHASVVPAVADGPTEPAVPAVAGASASGADAKPFTIRVRDGRAVAVITIRTLGGAIMMSAHAPAPGTTRAQREAAMRAWHGHVLLAAARPLIERWERALGVHANEVRVRDMRTRWGSCSGTPKRVWLSTRLAKKPRECLDYVVLHELTHLLVMDHGDAFAAVMDKHMPDWRRRRAALNARKHGSNPT